MKMHHTMVLTHWALSDTERDAIRDAIKGQSSDRRMLLVAETGQTVEVDSFRPVAIQKLLDGMKNNKDEEE
jgi:hypothetical protein